MPNPKNLPATGVDVDNLDVPREPEELRKEIAEAIETRVEKALKDIKENMTKKEYILSNRLVLLEKAKYIVDEMISNVLIENPTPRGFEVLGNLMKTESELIESVEQSIDTGSGSGAGFDGGSGSGRTRVVISQDVFDAVRQMRHKKTLAKENVETANEEIYNEKDS